MSSFWLVEQGIGEDRAALIDKGKIVAARIRRHDCGPFAGAVIAGRFNKYGASFVLTDDGQHIALAGPLNGLSDGAACHVRITRERLGEGSGDHRRTKPPRGRLVGDSPACYAPDLASTLLTDPLTANCPVQTHILAPPPVPDQLVQAGWHDILEQAMSGVVPFDGGRLIISPTPGMTVIDIDGSAASGQSRTALAKAAAHHAAQAILRLDIGGGVAIDFPSIEAKADRQAVAAAFDDAMAGPFERTAINGFGLMQIVRRRVRPSLVEQMQLAPARSALAGLLRAAQKSSDLSQMALVLDIKGAAILDKHPQWLAQLQHSTGIKPPVRPIAGGPDDYRLEPISVTD
jgi:hypothetical protein